MLSVNQMHVQKNSVGFNKNIWLKYILKEKKKKKKNMTSIFISL